MNAPKAPIPPGLGRQGEGAPGDVPFYGQVSGTSTLPGFAAPPTSANRWAPPMAGGWDPMTDAKRWRPPLATDASLRPQDELDAGRVELEIMNEVYGNVMDSHSSPYASNGNHGKTYHVDRYLQDRDAFFGSTRGYLDYRDLAFEELEADNADLRRYIEPNTKARAKLARWKEAQVCFYAWTRRAFENKLGSDEKIVGIIRAGTSPTLRAAIKQVRSDYHEKFGMQEANARPMKLNGSYRLGTLSDHAMGDAIDIDPAQNAQFTSKRWEAVLAYTGKSLDKATRVERWKSNPQALHTAIKEISDEFVKLLKAATDAKVAAGVVEKQILPDLLKDDKNLKVIGEDFIRVWRNGFFALPWALLKELHEEKLRWGAVFDSVDLHHFEVV
jgi:hypothetical protein